MKFIKNLIDWGKLTPLYDFFGKRSYSQSGEDLVVDDLLGRQGDGFYIDVGAYHPKVFSNTYLFYKRGWSGICIEPNPEIKWMHRFVRPRDIFVNCGVANLSVRSSQLEYFVFDEGATNTFDKKTAEKNIMVGRKMLKTIKVPVVDINSLLNKYVPKGKVIDLLSIDIEGLDLAILKSVDWKKYRPRYLVVEDLGDTGVKEFLEEKRYRLVGLTGLSMIFGVVE